MKESFKIRNKKTGEFIRRSTQGGKTAGSVAGYINKTDGYVRVRVDTQMWLAHRLAFLYVKGRFPRGELDHKDDVRSNNGLKNLRECSISLNCANRRMSSLNTSGYRGVYKKRKGLWYAKCGKNTLGYFLQRRMQLRLMIKQPGSCMVNSPDLISRTNRRSARCGRLPIVQCRSSAVTGF